MGDYKPILFVLLFIFILGGVLNLVISPIYDVTTPDNSSLMYDAIDFIENGFGIGTTGILDIVFPDLEIITISPVTWLWFGNDKVTSFVVDQLTLMTYIPNSVLIPILIILLVTMIYGIISLIRG